MSLKQIVPSRKAKPQSKSRKNLGWLLLVPASAVLALVIGWPLINLITLSFQEFGRAQVFGADPEFIGFENYSNILTDDGFWQVLNRSLVFAAVVVVSTMVVGTLVALLMNFVPKRIKVLVQIGLLVAWAMPQLTAVIVWGWMFNTEYGVFNYLLSQIPGVDFYGHSWLSNPISFFGVAALIITWQSVPFVALTIYAGLTQIPKEMIEAAWLDGASGWQRFKDLTFPLLRPIFTIVIILQIIWDLRVFTQIYALQGLGGLREETNTLGVYIYLTSLGSGEFGLGGAIAVVMVVLMSAVSAFYIKRTLEDMDN
jgi:N,N'-diacetylchitobiose transport system permease protein